MPKVVIIGGTGYIGRHLALALHKVSHTVSIVSRQTQPLIPQGCHSITWDGIAADSLRSCIDGADVLINLAGEALTPRRWTSRKKNRLWDSRVGTAAKVVKAIRSCKAPPGLFIAASAIGYYGDREENLCRETDPGGQGFLAELCQAWEAANLAYPLKNTRSVICRFGVVMGPNDAFLANLRPIFKLGLGGRLGTGKQWLSWIHIRDLCGAIIHLIEMPEVKGPVNIVSPEPIQNMTMTARLGRYWKRPSSLPVPAALLRLTLGPDAAAMLLGSQKVDPTVLASSGFSWRYPSFETALTET